MKRETQFYYFEELPKCEVPGCNCTVEMKDRINSEMIEVRVANKVHRTFLSGIVGREYICHRHNSIAGARNKMVNELGSTIEEAMNFDTFFEYETYITKYSEYSIKDFKLKSYLTDREIYYRKVWSLTEKNAKSLKNYDKRGRIDLNDDAHHIDHRYSVINGFINNIPPHIIADVVNLEMIPALDNIKKSSDCSITKEELLRLNCV